MPSTNRRGSRLTKNENKSRRRCRQTKVGGGVDHVKSFLAPPQYMANFAETGQIDFRRRAREAFHAADFLDRSGRYGEKLAGDAEENDLLRAHSGWGLAGAAATRISGLPRGWNG